MTAPRHVFFVSNARLAVHRRRGSKWLDPVPFDAGAEGLARFAHYLERHPGDPAAVIADVVEEEFREETIPHVFGADRRALLRKKASRLFRDARHVRSAVQGREPDGRRDDRVLFSAITRPGVLVPWLEEMARHGVPLAGICSPATLTGAMLKAIGAEGERVLVVSLQSGGGLRQTCLRRGRLELSRLAVMPGSCDAADVLAEVGKTRRYLDGLRTSPPGERLRVCLLSHGGMLDDLRRRAGGDPEDGCIFTDLSDAARRLGLRPWGGEPTADRLFVHALAGRGARNHYATPGEMRRFTTLRAAAFLRAASVLLVAGGFLFGGARFLEGAVANGHARALARHAAVYEGRYREARAALPPAPAEPDELQRVVAAVGALRARRADPVDLLALVGDALAEFPRVRVEGVTWWAGDAPEAPAGGVDGAGRVTNPDDPAADRGHASASGEEPPGGLEAMFQVARVSARIEPFHGDYRAAIDAIRRFAGALAASPGVRRVQVLSLPLELGPEQTLAGDAEAVAETAAFEIRVVSRAEVPAGAET